MPSGGAGRKWSGVGTKRVCAIPWNGGALAPYTRELNKTPDDPEFMSSSTWIRARVTEVNNDTAGCIIFTNSTNTASVETAQK